MSIFDAIWRRRGRHSKHEDQLEEELPVRHITMTERDYSDLLEHGDVAIKFWLPELFEEILNQQCDYADTTRSDLIRQNLFMYLYGRHDLWGLHEFKKQYNYYALHGHVMFSRSAAPATDEVKEPDLMQDLGKNTEDLKVWIPLKMKGDIQALADKASISLSEMIREIIISMLFGHTYLSTRKELMQMEIEIEEATTD